MARKDALLKLHQRLIAQRDAMRKKMSLQLEDISDDLAHGDSGDCASFDNEQEMHSQLAALESRELTRVERAIAAIRDGTYGDCEFCGNKIPVARLQALPHSSSCVSCQRRHEDQGLPTAGEVDWESAYEYQARENDRELTIHDIKIDSD